MSGAAGEPPGARLQPAEVTRRSGSSFLTGFLCLDRRRRAGMVAVYAFCRVADDAVDEAPDVATGERHLAFWRAELDAAAAARAATPIGRALQGAMQEFGVPVAPLADLLDGVATDLAPHAFADEAELERYCYRVASAVGLACLPVLGADSPGARGFANALGQALQRTNILRDLAADARAGRCYVPTTWLTEAGVTLDWLRGEGPVTVYTETGPVAHVRERLAASAHEQFLIAHAALRALPTRERRALVPARIMGAIYAQLLTRLEELGGDVRGPSLRVPRSTKLWLAAQVLAGARA
jgi:phytoene/squalene synthetase